jgi:fatty acid desaturase
MHVHPEELAYARVYEGSHAFESLTEDQLREIRARGRDLFAWFKAHPRVHNTINLIAMVLLLVADGASLLYLPRLWLTPGEPASWPAVLIAAAVAGSVHSYLLYSLSVFSMHEGAAHNIVFVGKGRLTRMAQMLARHVARVSGGDPLAYATTHMAHHAKFGTEDDAEFLNSVFLRRYALTFLPLAAFINVSDFIVHRSMTYTRSRMLSAALSTMYQGAYAFMAYQAFGGLFVAVAFLVFTPHVGFYLDRVRQFTEHNLMPLDNANGSRSFGFGFWGLLVGGGPWGSPCHWEHHLVPSLPWYQQLILHRHVVSVLTPTQRRQFLITPVIGFPRLWWHLVRHMRTVAAGKVGTARP